MIVLDASLLIAHLDAGDANHEEAEELLAGTGSARLGASTITLAEILVAPARQGNSNRPGPRSRSSGSRKSL